MNETPIKVGFLMKNEKCSPIFLATLFVFVSEILFYTFLPEKITFTNGKCIHNLSYLWRCFSQKENGFRIMLAVGMRKEARVPVKVSKFGGTSLADAEKAMAVKSIILQDSDRRIIVPSAPGKRWEDDIKITDLLIKSKDELLISVAGSPSFLTMETRFFEMAERLNVPLDKGLFSEIAEKYKREGNASYLLSRGEFLMGKILALLLGFTFVDAADLIYFGEDGLPDTKRIREKTVAALEKYKKIVVPGFYGCDAKGNIRVFSRGGSDITGALLAEAVNAELYENFTDVSGVFAASPRIVNNPRRIPYLSYRELRALSSFGASVLHEDAVFAVRRARIPIHILNTFDPMKKGTVVSFDERLLRGGGNIIGISGKAGYTLLVLKRTYGREAEAKNTVLLRSIHESGFKTEEVFFSTDTVSYCFSAEKHSLSEEVLLPEETVVCRSGLALISIVGDPSLHTLGLVFQTLAKHTPELLFAEKSPDGLNFYLCIPEAYLEDVIRALYGILF